MIHDAVEAHALNLPWLNRGHFNLVDILRSLKILLSELYCTEFVIFMLIYTIFNFKICVFVTFRVA